MHLAEMELLHRIVSVCLGYSCPESNEAILLKGYVGYYPPLNSVVVSNQGTDASKM